MSDMMDRINSVFNNPKLRRLFLKSRVPLGILFSIWLLFLLDPAWFYPGLAVSICGAFLQAWCMSTIRTQKKLTTTGPYMFVRNPMYLSRFLLVFGILLMTGRIWLVAVYVGIYYFYMINRVKREEKILSELFGTDYAAYCTDVRPYVPGLKRFDASKLVSLNRESIRENHVSENLAVVFCGYVVLYIFTFVWQL